MAKKQNGFGKADSFNVKNFSSRIDKGKQVGAAGQYPGNRQFGSSVHRSVIEKYDIDSDWTRWRKGIEYYYSGSYLDFEDLEAVLYQGTLDEVSVLFDGKQFSTANSDSRSHYTAKRKMLTNKNLGSVVEVLNDSRAYRDNHDRHEIWVRVEHSNVSSTSSMRRVIGERLTDGMTSANVLNVLTTDQRPTRYGGKTINEDKANLTVSINLSEIEATSYVQDNRGNLESLIGTIGYFPQFLIERNLDGTEDFLDDSEYFSVSVDDDLAGYEFMLLANTSELPPALMDIQSLTPIYTTTAAASSLKSRFTFQKSDYQRFFGQQYLTAEVVRSEVSELSFVVMPFIVKSVLVVNGALEITAEPFQSSLKLFTSGESENWIIFADDSFTKSVVDNDSNGNYLHDPPAPNEPLWQRLITNVDPWTSATFSLNNILEFAEVFCCSCPDFSHAVIRMPEATGDDNKPRNRQRKYPLPSAMGTASYDQAGLNEVAGVMQSWETAKYKSSFRLCKHTIAAMFINKIKVQEPNTYPSLDSRIKFEQRLKKDMDEVGDEFKAQLKRSSITTAEVVFMLSQGLNLDDVETAIVMLNANY